MRLAGKRLPVPRARPTNDPFAIRHRQALIIVWAHVPALVTIGLLAGIPAGGWVAALMVLLALAAMGTMARSQVVAARAVALGMIASSVVLVWFAGGAESAHTHFLAAVAVISLYRQLRILVLGTALAVLTEVLLGASTLAPSQTHPMGVGILNAALTLGLGLVIALGWRLDDRIAGSSDAERFRLSFEQAPLGMALLRPSGEFLKVNQALADLVGYEAKQLIGTSIRAIVHSDDMSALGDAWEEMGNGDSHRADAWLRCVTTKGRVIWARASLSLAPWTVERHAVVVLQLEDANRAHHEKQRLEALIQGRDEFIAQVADEMRRPVDDILAIATEADIGDRLRRVEAHTRELAAMVDDLMVSARPDVPVVARPLDAVTLAREVLETMPGAGGVALDVETRGVFADPGLTAQALGTLVANALRYGGPDVRVRIVSSGPDTVYQVSDDGAEIPESERERMFNADLRAGRPLTRPASVGLGFTVARTLARRMDGDLVYRRTAERRNQFELRLPAEQVTVIERPRGDDRSLGIPA